MGPQCTVIRAVSVQGPLSSDTPCTDLDAFASECLHVTSASKCQLDNA